ncbi:PAS domain-containing protein [Skermanella mucosa]|uniref:ATP-binding protein n=1 Tax=Skermanella mucosa TaxID=1789672 RepID=UPI00192C84EA|nr:ATP-binding protein [Skermanella mucosa]UEM20699.1 PAS domain-containing protein [Skermanella mucosa]
MKLCPEMLLRALDVSELAHTVSSLKGDMPLLYANQAFLDMTGYGRDEVVGRNCRFLQGPLTEVSALSRIRDGIAARETVQVNLVNYRKDGSTFVNHLYLAPVPDASGTPIAYMGIQSNVTPLHQRLRLDHEREKLAALGRLTAGISHEIKNALQPIRLMAEILEDWESLRPDDIRRSLATLRTNLDIALQLTTDVLGVARNPSHRGADAVAATVLAAETRRFVEGIVPDTVRLRIVDIPSGGTPGSVTITVRHFLQVIGNLVTNAVDAMQGRGDLTIRWGRRGLLPGEAEGLGLLPGDYLRIDILDTGCGVEERHLGELFETFFTTKPRDEGTGLGLAVSQSIVREAGGTITASSQAPGGSTFSIHLPTIHEA